MHGFQTHQSRGQLPLQIHYVSRNPGLHNSSYRAGLVQQNQQTFHISGNQRRASQIFNISKSIVGQQLQSKTIAQQEGQINIFQYDSPDMATTTKPVVKQYTQRSSRAQALYETIAARDPDQHEFLQAVEEVIDTLQVVLESRPELYNVLERLCEPERVVTFRVPWLDDSGKIRVNRGFRVQFSSALGPYKGGLRFHPSVNLSIIKFLGFEQIFKNSLTGLPLGGGKGGSDFDPKGKSDAEIMRFCQSFMLELSTHIGPNTDVPAGDIGVGAREIGYMFGQYKRLRNEFTGVLTGKGVQWGGSYIRPEATGYGVVYFAQNVLNDKGETLEGKRVAISGSGNVALFCAEKLMELGAVVVSFSDSGGSLVNDKGFDSSQLAKLKHLKEVQRGRLASVETNNDVQFHACERPWKNIGQIDIAMPCATQNELDATDAEALVKAGCTLVAEGSNMPSTSGAIRIMHDNKIEFAPAKATNAGGVAVSGLEMAQNSARLQWTRQEVDHQLQEIMKHIYTASKRSAKEFETSLQAGANITGFLKVADAMLAQGCV